MPAPSPADALWSRIRATYSEESHAPTLKARSFAALLARFDERLRAAPSETDKFRLIAAFGHSVFLLRLGDDGPTWSEPEVGPDEGSSRVPPR